MGVSRPSSPQSATAGQAEPRSDAELIAAVRSGERAAYGALWSRHEGAAHAFALSVGRPSDAEEMASEAFTRVLASIVDGGGPDVAFRPYLLSTIRRISIDLGRRYYERVSMTDQAEDFRFAPERSAQEQAEARAEQTTALRAWRSLPEASQAVLWHLVVERESLADIAPLLGTSPNGVATRATRAKERLRQAYLQEHIREPDDPSCAGPRAKLGAYTRGALSRRDTRLVRTHLAECAACTAAQYDLSDINRLLSRSVAPAFVGGPLVLAGYLTARHAVHPGKQPAVSSGTDGPPADRQPPGDGAADEPSRPRRRRVALLAALLVVGAVVGASEFGLSRTADRRHVQLAATPGRPGSIGTPTTARTSTPSDGSPRPTPSATPSATPPTAVPSRTTPSGSTAPSTAPRRTAQGSTVPRSTEPVTRPPSSASGAAVIVPVQRTVQLQVGRSDAAGTASFTVSRGWTITAFTSSDATVDCAVSATRGTCPIPAGASGTYRFTATVRPPSPHADGTLTSSYTRGPITLSHTYAL